MLQGYRRSFILSDPDLLASFRRYALIISKAVFRVKSARILTASKKIKKIYHLIDNPAKKGENVVQQKAERKTL